MAPNGIHKHDATKAFDIVQPKHRELVGGDLLAQSLKHLGVDVAFGLHGGHLDAFLMGASDVDIRLIDTRHECTAVQAAEGYSKVARKTGVCFFTANSGFGNALPGLSTAFADRSSIFCITSSAPLRDVELNVLQGFHDQIVVSKPVTKFCQRVYYPDEIPRLVAYAYRQAMSSPPGPVLLDFPIEVLFSPVHEKSIAWGSLAAPMPHPPGPHPAAIRQAVDLLRSAKRPAIISGTGGRFLKEDSNWLKFLDETQIPVFNSSKYSSPLPHDHPLRAGNAAFLTALQAIGEQQPDLIIMSGVRTGWFLGSRTNPFIPSNDVCKYIQIDVDQGEIGRGWLMDVGITSDVRPAFEALQHALINEPYRAPREWTEVATSLKGLPQPEENDPSVSSTGRLHPYHAVKKTLSSFSPGAIISLDGGECGSWTTQLMEHLRPSEVLFSCGFLGFLGNGWGYSLGAAIADPSRTVINVQGDGSAGFHLAELDSYARHGCKVVTIVFNNFCWGMSNAGQDLIYGRQIHARPTSSLSPVMDFAEVAKGMGCAAAKVSSLEKIKAAVQSLEAVDGPALLEVLTDNRPIHPGTIAMVGKTDDPNVVVVPYYDNVARPVHPA